MCGLVGQRFTFEVYMKVRLSGQASLNITRVVKLIISMSIKNVKSFSNSAFLSAEKNNIHGLPAN